MPEISRCGFRFANQRMISARQMFSDVPLLSIRRCTLCNLKRYYRRCLGHSLLLPPRGPPQRTKMRKGMIEHPSHNIGTFRCPEGTPVSCSPAQLLDQGQVAWRHLVLLITVTGRMHVGQRIKPGRWRTETCSRILRGWLPIGSGKPVMYGRAQRARGLRKPPMR